MKLEEHKLKGDGISHMETGNISGNFTGGQPDTIVIHYTAGSSAESSARWLTNPAAKASAHLVIGRGGNIIQLAPFNIITWHAGKSKHLGRSGLNKYSIGIEMDNPGPLKMVDGKFYTSTNRLVDSSNVVRATHRNQSQPSYWHRYTDEQLDLVEEICELLLPAYNIKHVVGHEEIAPSRKTDPGPAFPLDELRNKLFGNRSDEVETTPDAGVVSADFLNIRSGPGASNPKVAQPLLDGQKVKILEEENGWYKVETTITGWVSKNYISEG